VTLKLALLPLPYFPGPGMVLEAVWEDRVILLESTYDSLKRLAIKCHRRPPVHQRERADPPWKTWSSLVVAGAILPSSAIAGLRFGLAEDDNQLPGSPQAHSRPGWVPCYLHLVRSRTPVTLSP
jgi:hypothetical protein